MNEKIIPAGPSINDSDDFPVFLLQTSHKEIERIIKNPKNEKILFDKLIEDIKQQTVEMRESSLIPNAIQNKSAKLLEELEILSKN